ncbi:MAG: hypothetical protein H0T39_13775 [Actinobacteria bacterium]|nr:hypothetical protein [Actinomycetota bacterium]
MPRGTHPRRLPALTSELGDGLTPQDGLSLTFLRLEPSNLRLDGTEEATALGELRLNCGSLGGKLLDDRLLPRTRAHDSTLT